MRRSVLRCLTVLRLAFSVRIRMAQVLELVVTPEWTLSLCVPFSVCLVWRAIVGVLNGNTEFNLRLRNASSSNNTPNANNEQTS